MLKKQKNGELHEKTKQPKRKKQKSIKARLLTGILGLAISISLIFGIINVIVMYSDATQNMNIRLHENMTAYNSAVQNAIKVYEAKVESIAQDMVIKNYNIYQTSQKKALENIAAEYGFESIAYADENGNNSDGVNVGDREYFQHAIAGETYISSTMLSRVTNQMILVVAAQVTNGSTKGVVYARLPSDTFCAMVEQITFGETGYGFILDKGGKVIGHKNRDTVNSETNYITLAQQDSTYAGLAAMMQNMVNGNSGFAHETFNGRDQVFSYAPIPGTDGWSIGVTAVTVEMLKSLYISMAITGILATLFVAASLLIALKISAPIVKPILGLVKRIESLAEGDLHSEVPMVKTGDEIETLSTSFATTVDTLNAYIGEISDVLGSLANGDCTVVPAQDYRGDFDAIKASLNRIISNLNQTFTEIVLSAEQVSAGAEQVSSGAQALAAGSTEQASAIEELNTTAGSVALMAQQNTQSVRKAIAYVTDAGKGVDDTTNLMNSLYIAMHEIGDSSAQISKITKLVEDIAFQTNILALNAAVEAARAGEAGKGFAVVADEVRSLAGKSAEAAKQTAALIEKSTASVAEGEKLSDKTLKLLVSVSEKAQQVSRAVGEIDTASSEQVVAIEQISQGLIQVSGVVQSNAATAEQSSAASEEMAAQAQALQSAVEKFKLKRSEDSESFLFN